MDTRIPLMVNAPDFAGSMMNGLAAGGAARDAQRQNALAQLYQTQGPQIMAGDQNAMNALARMDPGAAVGIQQNQLGMQQTQQGMAFDAEKMQIMRDQAKAAVAQHAAQVSADQLAAEAAQTETMLRGAAPLYMAMQQGIPGAQEKLLGYLTQHGLPADPNNLDAVMYASQGALEGMKAYADLNKANEPPKPADEYQRYVQEEAAAGRKPLTRLEFSAASRAPATGMTVTTNPDGTTTITQGPIGAATSGTMAIDPRQIDTVVQSIDAIASDPSLNRVVGPIEGQGGNDVDQLGAARSAYYGGGGLSLIQKINQLQSTTWLAARQMLKGGGAITDYESKKAEAAMSRLSRVQGEAEFKAALKDLRDAVVAGQAKLAAANGGQAPAAQPTAPAAPAPQSSAAPDFSTMEIGQLTGVDISTLDEAGKAALSKRLTELGY